MRPRACARVGRLGFVLGALGDILGASWESWAVGNRKEEIAPISNSDVNSHVLLYGASWAACPLSRAWARVSTRAPGRGSDGLWVRVGRLGFSLSPAWAVGCGARAWLFSVSPVIGCWSVVLGSVSVDCLGALPGRASLRRILSPNPLGPHRVCSKPFWLSLPSPAGPASCVAGPWGGPRSPRRWAWLSGQDRACRDMARGVAGPGELRRA
eukprot:9488847-Pyramimonas_sp.AAC.1